MPVETIGETVTVLTDDHPARTDSPEYVRSRKRLMNTRRGGCVICGGVPDMTHPEMVSVANHVGLEDHHGGGIYVKDVLVALNLFPLEWSQGWGSDPILLARLVTNANVVLAALGEATYDEPIADVDGVMAYVDSVFNADVKFCKAHHTGHQTQHTPDANGHEAVGIHEIPGPIFWGQLTCAWATFDMWGGTTGTVAVAHATDPTTGRPIPGHVVVTHVHEATHPTIKRGHVLPPHHPIARLAHAGAHVHKESA